MRRKRAFVRRGAAALMVTGLAMVLFASVAGADEVGSGARANSLIPTGAEGYQRPRVPSEINDGGVRG